MFHATFEKHCKFSANAIGASVAGLKVQGSAASKSGEVFTFSNLLAKAANEKGTPCFASIKTTKRAESDARCFLVTLKGKLKQQSRKEARLLC